MSSHNDQQCVWILFMVKGQNDGFSLSTFKYAEEKVSQALIVLVAARLCPAVIV